MLLRIKDLPYEIDTAVEKGRRWVQVWLNNTCLSHFNSADDALDYIEHLCDQAEPRPWGETSPSVFSIKGEHE